MKGVIYLKTYTRRELVKKIVHNTRIQIKYYGMNGEIAHLETAKNLVESARYLEILSWSWAGWLTDKIDSVKKE